MRNILFRAVLSTLFLGLAAQAAIAPVKVGVYVQDIQDLDLKTHSYMMDLYVWFKWKDKSLAPNASLEFMNSYELWGHARSNEYEKLQILKSGENYQIIRNQGRFSHKLSLEDYPFDDQLLVIEFEDRSKESDSLRYELDEQAVVLNPELKLPGFKLGKPRIKVVENPYPTAFGDAGPYGNSRYSRVRVEIPIMRPRFTYAAKLMLPILCVIFCASLMFLFHPRYVDVRVGIGITALLTIVALQITLNEDLPQIDYLILMDKIYIASYFFVIAGIGLILKTTRMWDANREADALKMDRRALRWLLAVYGTGVAVLIAAVFL